MTGRKSILWVCVIAISSFCTLSIASYFVFNKRNVAKGDAGVTVTVNDSSLGKIQYQGSPTEGGDRCDLSTFDTTANFEWEHWYGDEYRIKMPNDNLQACPEDNAVFVRWEINGNDAGTNPIISSYDTNWTTKDNTESWTITAIFEPTPAYTVNVTPDDASHGTINIASGSDYSVASGGATGSYDISVTSGAGKVTTNTVSITPTNDLVSTPETVYFFSGFTSSTGATTWTKTNYDADEYTLTMTGDDTVTANFRQYSDIIYTASVNNPAVGSIDITGSNCANSTNQSFTKSLLPSIWYDDNNNPQVSYHYSLLDTGGNDILACVNDNHYRFSHWLVDGMNVSSDVALDDRGYWGKDGTNHTLQAVFVEDSYEVSFTTNGESKGQLRVDNTSPNITTNVGANVKVPATIDGVYVPSLIMTVKCNGDCSATQRTNSIKLSGKNGYIFHHFEITGNAAINEQTSSGYSFNLTGPATVTAIFGKYVFYEAGTIGGYTIDPVNPSNTSQTKTEEDAEGVITGVTINPNSVPLGAVFDHWEDAAGNNVSSSQTFVPSGSQLNNNPTYHPIFREVVINYASGTADGVTIPAIDIISSQTKTSESGLNPTGVTIDQSLIPNGWSFAGWADANGDIVSNRVDFVPTGADQIYDGAVYHPVFQEKTMMANISANDSSLGKVGYINDGGWQKCISGIYASSITVYYTPFHSGINYFDIPANDIYACPIGNASFVAWQIDGVTQSTKDSINRYEDSWAHINDTDPVKTKNIVAVFATAPEYTVGVNDPAAGKIDALGGVCGDSTNTNVDWISELIINGDSKTLGASDDPNITSDLLACPNTGYQFDYWLVDNIFHASTATTLARTSNQWPSDVGSHSLRAVFGYPITYLDGIVDGDSTKTVSTVNPSDEADIKHSELSTSVTGVTYSSTELANYENVKFAGWEEVTSSCTVPACPIISTETTFIPSGDQIYIGATYQPVFVTDDNYTLVVADDPNTGYISYWSDSSQSWIGRTDNGEFHVATVDGYVDGGIKATPRDGYVFDHWEYNGTTICTRTTSGCDEIVANELQYQAASGNVISKLVAHFVPATAKYHVFTGYTGGYGYYDHNLPETQRPDGTGAQAGKVTLTYYADNDSDIPGAYADFSGDQHPTAPNGYYFAYWITGCNSDRSYSELVTNATGNQDLMNVLNIETIVSFDRTFRPTRAQTQTCNEYVAVFYRKNQLRLIAQSENEAIGVVNATTSSQAEPYKTLCDNTLMRVKANLGVGVNANGYFSSCDATAVISMPLYAVSSWTFNGYTVLDATTHEPVKALKYRGDYVVEENGSYVSLGDVIVGDNLNYLVAHFELLPLPFTGSGAIWLLVGSGIGLVAIPSVILLAGERKQSGKSKDKGGKK